jgi:hypothetical protein
MTDVGVEAREHRGPLPPERSTRRRLPGRPVVCKPAAAVSPSSDSALRPRRRIGQPSVPLKYPERGGVAAPPGKPRGVAVWMPRAGFLARADPAARPGLSWIAHRRPLPAPGPASPGTTRQTSSTRHAAWTGMTPPDPPRAARPTPPRIRTGSRPAQAPSAFRAPVRSQPGEAVSTTPSDRPFDPDPWDASYAEWCRLNRAPTFARRRPPVPLELDSAVARRESSPCHDFRKRENAGACAAPPVPSARGRGIFEGRGHLRSLARRFARRGPPPSSSALP